MLYEDPKLDIKKTVIRNIEMDMSIHAFLEVLLLKQFTSRKINYRDLSFFSHHLKTLILSQDPK